MSGYGCPTGCGRDVAAGKLMCPSCWFSVPAELQRRVLLTWGYHRRLMRREGRTLEQVRESRAAYEQAKEAAIASIA